MKKKFGLALGMSFVLAGSLFLLAGCGGDDSADSGSDGGAEVIVGDDMIDIVGAWDNDVAEMSLEFDDGGYCVATTTTRGFTLSYYWDGEYLELTREETGDVETGYMDEEGDLILENTDGYFYRVDTPGYGPASGGVEDEGTSGSGYLDLSDTMWEIGDVTYSFYADGILGIVDGEGVAGSYEWDGSYGTVYVQGMSTTIYYTNECFFMVGEDGNDYQLTYVGSAY